jgi:hypothetical protein
VGLEDRIRKLEARAGQRQESADDAHRRRLFDRLYFELNNGRRELAGLAPLPTPPELEDSREDVLHSLRVLIPGLRNGLGWKSAEARDILRGWEDHALEQLTKLDKANSTKERTHD